MDTVEPVNDDVAEPPAKRKKQVLSLGQKVDILDRLRAGEGPTSVAKAFKLNESTVRSVKKNESKVRASLAAGVSKNMKLTIHNHTLRRMEKALSSWLSKQEAKGAPLSMPAVQKKARILHEQIKLDCASTKQSTGKDTPFLASKGWFMNFKKRYELSQQPQEASQVTEDSGLIIDYGAAEKFTLDLATLVREKGYKPEHVFNASDSQIFWKRLPKKTYISKLELESPGFKPSNDKLSFVLCVNASCDFMVKPMIVYRTQNPRALREKNKHHLPVFWKSNPHATVTAKLFNDWFHDCFVHEVQRYLTSKNLDFKVLLILDDSSSHTEGLQFAHPNVQVLFMPPNTACQLQPTQQGIVHIFKAHYSRHVFLHILTAIKHNTDAENVFQVWSDYSIADCVRNIKHSLDDMKPAKIKACWKNLWRDVVDKTNFLPSVRNEAKRIIKLSHRIKGEGFEDLQIREVEEFLKTHSVDLTDSESKEFLQLCVNDNDSEEMEISSKLHQMMENLEKAFQKNYQLCKIFFSEDPYMRRSLEFHKEMEIVLKPYRYMYELLKSKTDVTTIFFPESRSDDIEVEDDDLPLSLHTKPVFTNADCKNFQGFQKLSLRKAALSCPPKRAPSASAADARDGEAERVNGTRSVYAADLDRLTTPPFVTRRRPTYTSSILNDLSEPGVTPDLVINDSFKNSDSFKSGNNIAFSTPVSNDKSEPSDLLEDIRVFNSKANDQNFNKNLENDDLGHSLDVRLNNLNDLSEECISPKTANIMDDIYGDVWKHTPGLFKKTKSVFKNTQKETNSSNYDEILNKLDSLSLYVNSLTDVKVQYVQTNIKSFFTTSSKDVYSSKKKSPNGDLRPITLTFDLTNGPDIKNTHQDFRESETLLPDLIPCPDLDDSDLILSTKKVRKKNVFLSSSESDDSIKDLKPKNLFNFNIDESGESDKENTSTKKVKKKLSKKCRDAKKTSGLKKIGEQDCSVIIIESDDHIEKDFDKTRGKKIRKLFRNISKTNCMFDEVEFVSEDIKDGLKTGQEVIEIYDDGVRESNTEKILTKTYRKFNNAVYDDTFIDQFISEGVKNISFKTKEPNNKTKLIKKAPVKKKAPPPLTKRTLPTVEQKNVNPDEIQVYSFMASLSDNVPSWRCDKEARSYKDNYAKKKNDLIKKLFILFNEKVFNNQLDADLPIVWNANLNTTAGRAHNKIVKSKKSEIGNVRRSRVELSSKVLDGAQRLRDTLAHELCHVATWLIDGQLRDGHGPCWKKWVAKTLQAYPELVSIPVCHTLSIHYKYTYKCTKCGYSIDRHSKSIDTDKKRCGYCYGTLECIRNRKTRDGLVVSTPVKRTQRAPSGFALYVKENYGNVRGVHTPHKQVMQYLGRQYASLKAATPDAKQ